MSRRCRNCGRNASRRHRTVFSQGRFWLWVAAVIGILYVYGQMRGQA